MKVPRILVTGPSRGGRTSRWFTGFAVRRVGGLPVPVTPDAPKVSWSEIDAVVLGGGSDIDPARYSEAPLLTSELDPLRDELEWEILEHATRRGLPVLGVCRGAQLLNVFAGGSLHQDLRDAHPGHRNEKQLLAFKHIEVRRGTRLHHALGANAVRVNSLHRQGVARLGRGLVATAHDSLGIVQGIERPHGPLVLGVQWHPELLPGRAAQRRLFAALVRAASHHHPPATSSVHPDR